jgi:hypothetical protein
MARFRRLLERDGTRCCIGWCLPIGGGDVFDVPFALELKNLAVDAAKVLVIREGHEIAFFSAEGVSF